MIEENPYRAAYYSTTKPLYPHEIEVRRKHNSPCRHIIMSPTFVFSRHCTTRRAPFPVLAMVRSLKSDREKQWDLIFSLISVIWPLKLVEK